MRYLFVFCLLLPTVVSGNINFNYEGLKESLSDCKGISITLITKPIKEGIKQKLSILCSENNHTDWIDLNDFGIKPVQILQKPVDPAKSYVTIFNTLRNKKKGIPSNFSVYLFSIDPPIDEMMFVARKREVLFIRESN